MQLRAFVNSQSQSDETTRTPTITEGKEWIEERRRGADDPGRQNCRLQIEGA